MEQLEASRRKATSDPFVIYDFYTLLKDTIVNLKLENSPGQIWNLDESGFSSDPSRVRGIAGIGQKVHRYIAGSGKENTTVMGCVAASGKVLPPLIIFQGNNLWSTWKGTKDIPQTMYAASEKGWMTTIIFNQWFSKFCHQVKERPLLVILDGHITHLDSGTVALAVEQNITILKLPPHTTDVLQPLDVCCFGPLKLMWDTRLIEWQRLNQRRMTKSEFSDVLCEVWRVGITTSNVLSGFKSTGIFPVDATKYPVHRFDPEKLKRYNEVGLHNEVTVDESVEEIVFDGMLEMIDLPSTSTTPKPIQSHTPQRQSVSSKNSENGSTGSCVSSKVDFETLLLNKIKRTSPPSTTRRRLDPNARVITAEEYSQQIEALKKKHIVKHPVNKSSKPIAKKRRQKILDSSDSEEVDNDLAPPLGPPIRASAEDGKKANGVKGFVPNSYVIVLYEGEYFPGVIVNTKLGYVSVSVMTMSGPHGWKWGDEDILWYPEEDIIEVIKPPTTKNGRLICEVPELAKYRSQK